MTISKEGREFVGDGMVKVTFVGGEDGEQQRTLYSLQRIQGFKNIHLIFDEELEALPKVCISSMALCWLLTLCFAPR